jgi:hypothetical protein
VRSSNAVGAFISRRKGTRARHLGGTYGRRIGTHRRNTPGHARNVIGSV